MVRFCCVMRMRCVRLTPSRLLLRSLLSVPNLQHVSHTLCHMLQQSCQELPNQSSDVSAASLSIHSDLL